MSMCGGTTTFISATVEVVVVVVVVEVVEVEVVVAFEL